MQEINCSYITSSRPVKILGRAAVCYNSIVTTQYISLNLTITFILITEIIVHLSITEKWTEMQCVFTCNGGLRQRGPISALTKLWCVVILINDTDDDICRNFWVFWWLYIVCPGLELQAMGHRSEHFTCTMSCLSSCSCKDIPYKWKVWTHLIIFSLPFWLILPGKTTLKIKTLKQHT